MESSFVCIFPEMRWPDEIQKIYWFCSGHDCIDLNFHQPHTNDLSQPPHSHRLLFILGMRRAVFYQVEDHTDLKMLSRNVGTQGGSSQQWMETWNRKSISVGFYPETPAWLISTWLVCRMLEDALVILKVSQIRKKFS